MKKTSTLILAATLFASSAALADTVNLTDGGSVSVGSTTVTCSADGSSARQQTYCDCEPAMNISMTNCSQTGWAFTQPYYLVLRKLSDRSELSLLQTVNCEFPNDTTAIYPADACSTALALNPSCH